MPPSVASTSTSGSASRRTVVPPAARRSLWRASAWTGFGAALVGAIASIAVVAICWLPASGGSGSAASTMRAGVLTFLAAVHGGITVGGVPTAFVPLGMTILLGLLAWRIGRGLADVAADMGEQRLRELAWAGLLQSVVFGLTCAVLAHLATLGQSSVSPTGVAVAGFVLFAATGGVAYVRSSPLGPEVADRLPAWAGRATRAGAAGVAVYLSAGALLVAGSLVVHADRVETLSTQVGGGWSGVPVLLLGVLAAPNAAIAGGAYAAGPGFALGTGNHVSAFTTAHGLLPAFPILGSVPSGAGATWYVLLVVALTPAVAAAAVAVVVRRADDLTSSVRDAGAASGVAALAGVLLGWQGGGAIGSGRLNAVGASPWQLGLAFGVELGVLASVILLAGAALDRLRRRPVDESGRGPIEAAVRSSIAAFAAGVSAYRHDHDHDGTDDADDVDGRRRSKTDRLAG